MKIFNFLLIISIKENLLESEYSGSLFESLKLSMFLKLHARRRLTAMVQKNFSFQCFVETIFKTFQSSIFQENNSGNAM